MKTRKRGRILAFVLALAMILSTVPSSTSKAAFCDCKNIVKLTAKTTGVTLREGQILTKSMVKKALKVTASYENGKKKSKYTSYKVKQVGKTIKPTKGKYKVTIYVGKVKKTVSVKVNQIKKIYIKQSKQTALQEGSTFSTSAFKKKTIVYADYKKGADKKLTTYTVVAPEKVIPNQNGEFVVTVKYGNKKDTIAIPVIPKPEPTTEQPTTEAPTTETPTTQEPTTQEPTTEEPTTEEPSTEEPVENTVTVKVTRNGNGDVAFNNETVIFSNDTVTQKVAKGSSCVLTATNTSEYKFVRWIDDEGKELSTDKTYSFTATENMTLVAVFERVYIVTVNRVGGKGRVTLAGEQLDFYSDVATTSVVPSRYDLAAVSTDDYNFVSWTDSNGKVLSTDPTYNVAVSTANIEVTVNFAEAEKTVNVTYSHDNGQLLISEAVVFGETLAPPTKDIWKADKTFAGWKIGNIVYSGEATATEFYDVDGNSLSDAIKVLTAQKQNVNVVSYYVDNPVQYYTVNITGGEIVSGEITDGKVSEGAHMYIKATVPEGKAFAGWTDADGNIQSYEEEYDFYVTSDVTLIATFSDEEIEAEPVVHFTGSKYELYPDDYGVRLYMASEIPEGYTKIEWGFLYTAKELSESEMVVGGTAKSVINSSGAGNADWIYDARFPASAWEAGKTVKIRIYATVSSAEGTKTIYSEILSVKLASE